MSSPHTDGTKGAVREGLRRLVRRAGAPPPRSAPAADRVGWRNLLLDEVGSDARPLADLLLRVEGDGVVAAIPAGALAPIAWAPVRARLAFGYAAETFLDAEVARWAVDAWAYALGAIDATGLYVAPPVAPLPPPIAVVAPAPARLSVVVPATATTAAPGALPPPVAARKVPGSMRRAMARANAPPAPNPFPQNFDRIAGFTFMGMVTAAAVAIWVGIAERREAGGLEVSAGPAPAHAGLAVGPDGAPALDSLHLRDGTVRTGVVERLTEDGIVLRDPWSDTAAPLAFGAVAGWRAPRGAWLPVGDAAAADAPVAGRQNAPAPDASPMETLPPGSLAPGAGDLGHVARIAGLSGRYTVRRRVLDVSGSESCSAVAASVRAAAPTVETVAHRPGEAELALTSRPGLRGTVDDDGRFRTNVVEGARDGVQYRFRMVGQFLPDGFRAETESETRAVIRWGDVQRCRVSVALAADRLP